MFSLQKLTIHGLILILLAFVAMPSVAAAANDRYRVQANLVGAAPFKGKARYEERQKNGSLMRNFKVELQNGVPGSTHVIRVRGAQVGTITINALGRGQLQLRTAQHIDSPGDGKPMPSNFPKLVTGNRVSAGPLDGVIFIIDNGGGGGGGSGGGGGGSGGGGGGGGSEVRLRGDLIDNTPADGKAEYREIPRGSALERRFKVEIEDAPANTAYQVRVNGQVVTTITTNGAGFVEFQYRTAQFIDSPGDGIPMPDNFPSLQPGDVVTVGVMSATLQND